MVKPEKGSHQLRIGRISAQNNVHFLTSCLKSRSPLLRGEAVQNVIHNTLSYWEEKEEIYWYCYNIMPDHIHLLFRLTGKKSLPQWVHSLKRHTARRINSLSGKAGSLWQEGFFAHRIRSEADFWETALYIFRNPVEDGLTSAPGLWPGWRCKPEVARWIRQWEAEEAREQEWLSRIRQKRELYQ